MLHSMLAQLFIAFALGLDAFSVCLGIGLQPIRLKKIAAIGLWIGGFHIIMPLLGLLIGSFLFDWISDFTELISGLLLVGLGMHIIFNTFAENYHQAAQKKQSFHTSAMLVLAFSVSLDSLPVGISLGVSGFATTLTLLIFGIVTTILTWISLLIAKKIQHNFDRSFDWIGGLTLCIIGLTVIF
ncbi:Putative Mn2+ efflux pump MntP [Amphibacillus marinus]|uniref:Putative Mn2+ efflux pump MntP n=1 Tax=Amphibacillus marinus TaxID=872970 RepID=A0A1H8N0T2_9BACI|nr:manganese efflux pump [Amphibacillus marinus]SEO23174.1 Putative Mn2+ efflux pump MntP [Amphibacillus marinus]